MKYIPQTQDNVVITNDMARYILAQYGYEGQRKVSKLSVSKLLSSMDNGNFGKLFVSEVRFAKCDALPNGYALIDGQTRMQAMTAATEPQRIHVRIDEFDTLEEVASCYASMDTIVRPRNNGSIIETYLKPTKELPRQILSQAMKAVPIIEGIMQGVWERTTEFHDPIHVANKVKEYAEPIKLYNSFIKDADRFMKPRLVSLGVFIPGVITAKEKPHEAEAFWTEVVSRPTRRDDPRYALEGYFRNNPRPNKPWVDTKYVAEAWNRMMSAPKEPVTSLKISNSSKVLMYEIVSFNIRLKRGGVDASE